MYGLIITINIVTFSDTMPISSDEFYKLTRNQPFKKSIQERLKTLTE